MLAFVRELAVYEKLESEIDASAAMLETALFGDDAQGANVHCEFAEWDGEPVGIALWFLNFSSFRGRHGIYLEDVFVRPAFRAKGIGKALLRHLAQRCVAEGWTRVEWSVLDWNAPAIDFYRSQGATLMDGWTTCRLTGDALARLAAE